MSRMWSRLKQATVVLMSIVVVMVAGTGVGFAGDVDQQFGVGDRSGGDDICDGGFLAQTFTAGATAFLTGVAVRLTQTQAEPVTVTVQIRTVSEGTPTETVLSSGAVVIPGDSQNWTEIQLPWIHITNGQQYALALTRNDCAENIGSLEWDYQLGDSYSPYPGGNIWVRHRDNWHTLDGTYFFRTYFDTGYFRTSLYKIALSTGKDQITLWGHDSNQTTSVSNEVDSLTLTPELSYGLSHVTVNGTPVENKGQIQVPLAVGDNVITMKVTTEDGATRVYHITVHRAVGSNANLRGIVVQGSNMLDAFNPATTEYALNVGSDVKELTVGGITADRTASVTINGKATNYGGAVTNVALTEGTNTVTFDVTAQDGVTHKTYTLVIIRGDSK